MKILLLREKHEKKQNQNSNTKSRNGQGVINFF